MIKYPAQATTLVHTNSFQEVYPSVFGYLKLQNPLDIPRFLKSIEKMQKVFPQLFCRYDLSTNTFISLNQQAQEIFLFIEEETDPLIFPLDFLTGCQLTIFYREKEMFSELFFLESHLVGDGATLKKVMALLIAFYNKPDLLVGNNSQNLEEILTALPKKGLSQTYRQDTTTPLALKFPLLRDEPYKKVHQTSIEKKDLTYLHGKGKAQGLTLNDLFLTGYMRLLKNYNPNVSSIALACPTDLRQFLPKEAQKNLHLGNFTARYNPQVTIEITEDFLTSAKKVHQEMIFLKENYQFLQSILPLVENFKSFSLKELKNQAKKNYHMRKISYTNMALLEQKDYAFFDNQTLNAFTSGAFRKAPMFQVCFSTFSGNLNLVANVIGDDSQQKFAKKLLEELKEQLLSAKL